MQIPGEQPTASGSAASPESRGTMPNMGAFIVRWTLHKCGRRLNCRTRWLPPAFELHIAIDDKEPFFSRRFTRHQRLRDWAEGARMQTRATCSS